MKNIVLLLCLILLNLSSFGQEIPFEKIALSDSIAIAKQMQQLAKLCIKKETSQRDRYRAQIIGGNYQQAIAIIDSINTIAAKDEKLFLKFYNLFATAKQSTKFKKEFSFWLNNKLQV